MYKTIFSLFITTVQFFNAAGSFRVIYPQTYLQPTTVEQVQEIVKHAGLSGQKISICGARQSQGGQATAEQALLVDITRLNKVLAINVSQKLITVQTGITWKQIQDYINPYGLAVKAMQSYSDFTLGGSLGVNAHGQDIHVCSLSSTVQSFKLVLADGSLIEADRNSNRELFRAALGGYGLFGIIVEATLELTDDIMLKKEVCIVSTENYARFFEENIKNNKSVALHSARLSINPRALFEKALAITYYEATDARSNHELSSHSLKPEQFAFKLLRKSKLAKKVRFGIETHLIERPAVMSRNNAMRFTIQGLQNRDPESVDILQEYFIPTPCLSAFLEQLKQIINYCQINLLNVTIRYVKAHHESLLTYASQDSFALVLFINVRDNEASYEITKQWTKLLIESALTLGGKYYLPYHLFATKEQFQKAYPAFHQFLDLKKRFDPGKLFINQLYNAYTLKIV